MSSEFTGALIALLVPLCFGSGMLLARVGLVHIPPGAGNFVSLIVGWVLVAEHHHRPLPRRAVRHHVQRVRLARDDRCHQLPRRPFPELRQHQAPWDPQGEPRPRDGSHRLRIRGCRLPRRTPQLGDSGRDAADGHGRHRCGLRRGQGAWRGGTAGRGPGAGASLRREASRAHRAPPAPLRLPRGVGSSMRLRDHYRARTCRRH